MGFPGTWATTSESVVYRVVPKCACSTIGQIMYYSDHGEYFDGDIHDAQDGIYKWNQEQNRDKLSNMVRAQDTLTFTCVRNPYSRVLSSFFDKICGVQRNGMRYRNRIIPELVEKYGVEIEGEFDQIKSFRRFLLFVRDTIRFRRPMDPDIHWSAMAGHVSTLIVNGGHYDRVVRTEMFNADMRDLLNDIDTRHDIDLEQVPRFNESEGHGPKRAHPIGDYFDDLSMYLMHEIYKRDFAAFNYDFEDPYRKEPKGEVDLDLVHAMLGD